jgi:hypothetical protein
MPTIIPPQALKLTSRVSLETVIAVLEFFFAL